MTCGLAREAILDLARNVPLSDLVRAAAEAHLRKCASCAADFARQRDLTAALGALAGEAQAWTPSAGIEKRLREAFDNRLTGVATRATGPMRFDRRIAALTIAAAIALAVWLGNRSSTDPAADRHAHEGDAAPAASSLAPQQQARREPVVPMIEPRSASQAPTGHRGHSSRRNEPSNRVRSFEFLALPGAVGLPDLESGSILRIAVPVGALPEYGLAIETNGTKTTVEADVLVGQDGMARAIRLVGVEESTQDARSRR